MFATAICQCSAKMVQEKKNGPWTMEDGSSLISVDAPAGFADSESYQTAALNKDPNHYNSCVEFHNIHGMYPWQHQHAPGAGRQS